MPLFIHSIHFQLFFNQLNQTQFHAVLWCLIWFLFRIQLERRGSLVCLHFTVETLGLLSWHLTCPLSALLNLYGKLPALFFFIIQTDTQWLKWKFSSLFVIVQINKNRIWMYRSQAPDVIFFLIIKIFTLYLSNNTQGILLGRGYIYSQTWSSWTRWDC